jgi:hypothetical protein
MGIANQLGYPLLNTKNMEVKYAIGTDRICKEIKKWEMNV